MRILAVDDDQLTLKALQLILEPADHELTTCENGMEAMDMLDSQNFDIVITDLIMPVKNGIALIEHIKKLDTPVPVLAISSNISKDNEDNANADDFTNYASYFANDTLSKPFNKTELLSVVERLYNNRIASTLYA